MPEKYERTSECKIVWFIHTNVYLDDVVHVFALAFVFQCTASYNSTFLPKRYAHLRAH